ncbi:uncharacterized protein LOC135107677 [Scylla paramamosain]|uniref:uncharacterized protein LOC135107677 n=1 Tax=Scylla paramamosain TaxID=85552 RepID=UPI003083049A
MAGWVGVRVTTATLVVVVLVVMVVAAQAYPSVQGDDVERGLAAFRRSLFGSGPVRKTQNQCTNNAMQQHTCEMCAKETKSQKVYSLCCTGEDNALNWCQSFLHFGII